LARQSRATARHASSISTTSLISAAGRAMGLQIQFLNASTNHEIDEAFETFVGQRPDALFVAGDALFIIRRVQLATLAARYAIPATFPAREYTEAGGLMSYGSNLADTFRQVGVYAGRILKGAKPADLPVMQNFVGHGGHYFVRYSWRAVR
jgi:ABC-type uncharacterized transport system substrate-binding protein